ncbi:SET domain-containing protein 9 [Gryganskiella cystojenkinii]|nr:SET domain-containing protein 9 [Gryganskiella cystojenkinii]
MRDFVHRFYPYQAFKLLIQRVRPSKRRIGPVLTTATTALSRDKSHPVPFDPDKARTHLVEFFRALRDDQLGEEQHRQNHTNIRQDIDDGGSSRHPHAQHSRHHRRYETSLKHLGFALEVYTSKIPHSGLGVFLRIDRRCQGQSNQDMDRGKTSASTIMVTTTITTTATPTPTASCNIPPGTIVGMYPGLLYRPGEAILFNSIQNRYILKCNDGIFVDAKAQGLSGYFYRSVNARDNYPGITPTADTTWMFPWAKSITSTTGRAEGTTAVDAAMSRITPPPRISTAHVLKNPLAVGQLVNNGTSLFPSNVRYQELDFRTRNCPLELQQFLPNLWHAGDWHSYDEQQYGMDSSALQEQHQVQDQESGEGSERGQGNETGLDSLRTVVLVTTREIADGEELYSTYIE